MGSLPEMIKNKLSKGYQEELDIMVSRVSVKSHQSCLARMTGMSTGNVALATVSNADER